MYEIFIHIFLQNNWKDILKEQLDKIVDSGLSLVSSINLCVVHDHDLNTIKTLKDFISYYPTVKIQKIENNKGCGECVTIKEIKKFCDKTEEDTYILYLHSKGVTQYGSERELPVTTWRRLMEYYLINNWEDCITNLAKGYDCCGVNYQDHAANINGERRLIKIFNGNFFWTKSSYVKKIDENFNFTTRYCPENWILSIEHNPYIPNNDYADKDLYHNTIEKYI